MDYKVKYELDNIHTEDIIYCKNTDEFIKKLMAVKNGREKLVNKKLSLNIYSIEKVKYDE